MSEAPQQQEGEPSEAVGAQPGVSRVRSALLAAARWLLPEDNPTGVIYGVIAIGSLLAAESDRHESYLDSLLSLVLASCLYWLAHAYASTLGSRLESRERLSAGGLARALAHDLALLRGAAVPTVALLLAWALGARQETGVTAGLWSAIASLVALELLAGVRAEARAAELALDAAVGVAMGTGVLALKIVLH